ncbi:hypothetical protein HF086_017769 [Spodoptera exigua]|uniref:Helicase ATP-binding domain-containing protein n=1 Tax=Spodoptera exigua TaxID=7107 RepID=A0A922SDC9_SPOEX|nr:hypothetical protein HF086_017769 [Spodoptera exigua]
MSEDSNSISNNLCIPEDAFEQFQAVSMYQEEEYITLPIQASVQPKELDPGENVIRCDTVSTKNEVNSSVNNTENVESSLGEETLGVSSSENYENISDFDKNKTNLNLTISPRKPQSATRRGRKKKENTVNNIPAGPGNVIILGTRESCEEQLKPKEESVVGSNTPPQKRGRKSISQTSEGNERSGMGQECSVISNPPLSSNLDNSDLLTTMVKRKRGRPRKTSITSEAIAITPPTDKISNTTPTRRKGRPRKNKNDLSLSSLTNDKNNQLRDANIENLNSSQSADIIQNEQSDLTQTDSEKNIFNKTAESGIKIDSDDSSNDELDNICLSKLKTHEKVTQDEHISENAMCAKTENTDLSNLCGKIKNNLNKLQADVEKLETDLIEPLPNEGQAVINLTANKVTNNEKSQDSDSKDIITINKPDLIDQNLLHNTENNSTVKLSATEDVVILDTESNNGDDVHLKKRNNKMPVMADFEYNIDKIMDLENRAAEENTENSELVEDTSKRPVRRKVPKLRYDEGSDEDPFANIELSDDDEPRRRKGNRYYSDDEYVPGRRGNKDIDSTDSETQALIGETGKKPKKKKLRKKSENRSPRKKGKQKQLNQDKESDVEICLPAPTSQSSDIEICLPNPANDEDQSQTSTQSKTWGCINEFEHFIAKKIQGTNIQIKKVSAADSGENKTLEIPTIDPDAKKSVEMWSQTNKTETKSTFVQTKSPFESKMKINVDLTSEQSKSACSFLNGIVKMTSELGSLMIEKSEDFMKKKINTTHVTDTMKMDYCVRKSFLLFKLAKHNLEKMEEDLEIQYEKFLETHNLTQCREVEKEIVPSSKKESDSDCEIVDEPTVSTPVNKSKETPKFNPKTVFLNKELSIKIAKKPTENKTLNIKGRHAVWINDTVMVKKVKPTQSFLAQDSRNKKPPDNKITTKMVSDFFRNYSRKRAISICAPFITTTWLNVTQESVCNYFVVKQDQCNNDYSANVGISPENNASTSQMNHDIKQIPYIAKVTSPKTLLQLCIWIANNKINDKTAVTETSQHIKNQLTDGKNQPETLFRLCLRVLTQKAVYIKERSVTHSKIINSCTVPLLKTICYQKVVAFLHYAARRNPKEHPKYEETRYTTKETKNLIPTSLPEQLFSSKEKSIEMKSLLPNCIEVQCPETLSGLCIRIANNKINDKTAFKETSQHMKNEGTNVKNHPETLFRLCLRVLTNRPVNMKERSVSHSNPCPVSSVPLLKTICYQKVVALLCHSANKHQKHEEIRNGPEESNNLIPTSVSEQLLSSNKIPKTLFQMCLRVMTHIMVDNKQTTHSEIIQQQLFHESHNSNNLFNPQSLKSYAFEYVKQLIFEDINVCSFVTNPDQSDVETMIQGLTINSVNTLSEEAFLSLEQAQADDIAPEYFEELDENNYDDDDNYLEAISEETESEPNWVSQVQMQELRSCTVNGDENEEGMLPLVAQIKIEPMDEELSYDVHPLNQVKIEPIHAPNEMTMIPEVKIECLDDLSNDSIPKVSNKGYDVEVFEKFVSSSKIISGLCDVSDDIFSQSAFREHRRHEPDYEEDDMSMSLLVPQTYEPLTIETAKGSLMQSSSDEDDNKNKKLAGKKKADKKHKSKQKKPDPKGNKEIPTVSTKDQTSTNEVAYLTRRLRDKIHHEEKKDDSLNSELENTPVRLRNKKEQENTKQSPCTKEDEVQCNIPIVSTKDKPGTNEVTHTTRRLRDKINHEEKEGDTTDPEPEDIPVQSRNKKEQEKTKLSQSSKEDEIQCNNVDSTDQVAENASSFIGFSDIDQKEISIIHNKYMKFVHGKILPENQAGQSSMPVLDELLSNRKRSKKDKNVDREKYQAKTAETSEKVATATSKQEESPNFIVRHDWHCYPVNGHDKKLYLGSSVILEKLPESFVQTYFAYQDIASKSKEDEEINRLTNLSSLNRTNQSHNRGKNKLKSKENDGKMEPKEAENASDASSRSHSPTYSDHQELEPSDDEGTNIEYETAQPVATRNTENTLAKNLLMNENESDSDDNHGKIKQEPAEGEEETNEKGYKTRSRGNKKKDEVTDDKEELMLTADKMMNKELKLLHAPVVISEDVNSTPTEGTVTRNKQKSAVKSLPGSSTKTNNEEDSSSEEEKQWVSTKEKLLKRLVKKDQTSVDDAKRAKLVSEFIERRGGRPNTQVRRSIRPRRSAKKFLEREKQLGILSRELFGESTDAIMSKRSQVSLYKGRRNIRKVIDKKSLARSTVVANMEEFERKRRLNAKQTKLRELLGCEEGVNVLVINDEVCLEYDFEENRPVVTIHPFFTKVMKAHQVLTHPGVNMQRVLVCCPLSTVLNWVDEIHKWIGPVTNQIKVFELSKLRKTYERAYQLEDWYNGGGIFIIGYELFRSLTTLDPYLDDVRPTIINKIRTALLDPGPDIIVCDEGHLLKNDCSVLTVAMSRVVTRRRIILTGTPMQNNLREYYCMVNFVKPNLLGTYAEYSNRFENPITNGQHRDSSEEDIKLMKARTHILHKVLEGCLQRQEASVLYPYLPKKHEYTVFINLTQCQWDLYKHYLNNYAKQSKQNILKDFHILQKIWSHPQVLHNFQTKARDREERNKLLKEKLEDDLATEDVEDIKPNLSEDLWWLDYLDGGNMLETLDSSNKFVVIFRLLDECIALGDKVLFLVSTRAGCLGLNMTSANRVIIMDTSWNPAHDIQSIFRGTMEQKIYERSVTKQAVACRVVDEQQIDRHYNSTELTELYTYDEAGACVAGGVAAGVRDVALLRVARDAVCAVHAVHEHDSLLRGEHEQALPEHERNAVWMQFQQEQAHKRTYGRAAGSTSINHAHCSLLHFTDMEDKAVTKGPRISLKRVTNAETQKLATEVKTEPKDEDPTPNEPKPKKGKKSVALDTKTNSNSKKSLAKPGTSKQYEEQPSTSCLADQSAVSEEILVDQITDILLKYNFQNRKRKHMDITNVVTRVRNLVNKGYIEGKDWNDDDMTANIAKVLLNTSGPKVIDIVCESINNSVAPDAVLQDDEATKEVKNETNPNERTKRKAAVAAEICIDSLAGDIINLDDDEWTADTEFIPDKPDSGKRKKKLRNTSINAYIDENTMSADEQFLSDTMEPVFESFKTNDKTKSPEPKPKSDSKKGISIKNPKKVTNMNRRSKSKKQMVETEPQRAETEPQQAETESQPAKVRTPPAVIRKHVGEIKPRPAESKPWQIKVIPRPSRSKQWPAETNLQPAEKIIMLTAATATQPAQIRMLTVATASQPAEIKTLPAETKMQLAETVSQPAKFLTLSAETNSQPAEIRSQPTETAPQPAAIRTLPLETRTQLAETKPKPADFRTLPTETIPRPADIKPRPTETKPQPPKEPKDRVTVTEPMEDSIILSDDDDIPVDTSAAQETLLEEPSEDTSTLDHDNVPLPMSLLKNQNFINIVAHTYLVGNPMLDEDAATLAAQYSTLKAFNEAEQTGKLVYSGPIYDIAVKVIGKDVMRKMSSLNPKAASTSASCAATSLQMKDQMITTQKAFKETANKSKHNSASLREKLIKEKLNAQTQLTKSEVQPPPPKPNDPCIVPVGLIRTTARESRVECILPDNDNIIISDVPPAAPGPALPSPVAAGSKTINHNKPILLNNILRMQEANPVNVISATSPTGISTNIILKPIRNLASSNKSLLTDSNSTPTKPATPSIVPVTVTAGPAQALPPSVAQDTICLDSDDEDSPAPPPPPGPVPVSLTSSLAPGIKLPLLNMPNHVLENCTAAQKLKLEQLVTGQVTQPKFVVIPNKTNPNFPNVEKPPKPVPIAPKLPQPHSNETSSTLKETILDSVIQTKKSFKAGDVLRLTKNGKIELVNNTEAPSSLRRSNKPQVEVLENISYGIVDLTEPPPNASFEVAKKKVPPKVNKKTSANKVETRVKTRQTRKANSKVVPHSSSTSSTAVDLTSEDPLNVLKDIIHIKAADYQTNDIAATSVVPRADQSTSWHGQGVGDTSPVLALPLDAAASNSKSILKLTKIPKDQVPKHIDDAVLKEIKKQALLKRLSSTNQFNTEQPTSISSTTPTTKIPLNDSKLKSLPAASVDHSTNLKSKIDGGIKRQSTMDTTPVKKKKNEPMTLKDFDLDDIDDIIELD